MDASQKQFLLQGIGTKCPYCLIEQYIRRQRASFEPATAAHQQMCFRHKLLNKLTALARMIFR